MLRLLFTILITVHGLIHFMGFVKAFDYAKIETITREITKPMGLLWLLAMVTLVVTASCYFLKINYWWAFAFTGAIMSQALIHIYWQEAKFGTLANIIILITGVLEFAEWRHEKQYRQEVDEILVLPLNNSILTQESLVNLPEPVKRYIVNSGAIGKPVPKTFKIKFKGQLRQDEHTAWIPFTSEQFNSIEPPARLFFMKAKMKGLPVVGYHSFKNGRASMDIRLFSLFTVQYQDGDEMNQSETVTWFNDLCLFAPGALIDKRISWEAIDDLTAKATFTNEGITISAVLYFNNLGELLNFVSDNRYRMVTKTEAQLLRFSTPVKNYKLINNHLVPSFSETVWNLAEGDLIYGQFNCEYIQYNVRQ